MRMPYVMGRRYLIGNLLTKSNVGKLQADFTHDTWKRKDRFRKTLWQAHGRSFDEGRDRSGLVDLICRDMPLWSRDAMALPARPTILGQAYPWPRLRMVYCQCHQAVAHTIEWTTHSTTASQRAIIEASYDSRGKGSPKRQEVSVAKIESGFPAAGPREVVPSRVNGKVLSVRQPLGLRFSDPGGRCCCSGYS